MIGSVKFVGEGNYTGYGSLGFDGVLSWNVGEE